MATTTESQVIATVPRRRRMHPAWIIAVVLALVAAGFVGYWIGQPGPKPAVHLEATVTGTINLLNTDRDAGCMKLDHPAQAKKLGPPFGSGGVCGVFSVYPTQTLHRGERVAVAVMQAVDEHGRAFRHLLVVYQPVRQ